MKMAIDEVNSKAENALGYGTPGFQPDFHGVLAERQQSIKVNDPLSVSAPAKSFFISQDETGRQQYSRRGDFSIQDGVLIDGNHHAVLASGPQEDIAALSIIRIDPSIDEKSVSIDGKGRVSALNMQTKKRVVLGRLALAQFGFGTVVDRNGSASSGKPENIDFAGSAVIKRLKTSSRDVGSVDHMGAILDFGNAESTMEAAYSARKVIDSSQKTADDLIK